MTCPEKCTQHLENIDEDYRGIKKTLYGEDGNAGVAGCIKKKVSWAHLGTIVFSILIIFGGYNLYAVEKKDKKVENVDQKATENAQKVEVIKQDIRHIKENMREQKTDIREIKDQMVKKKDLDVKFELLLQAIKKKE